MNQLDLYILYIYIYISCVFSFFATAGNPGLKFEAGHLTEEDDNLGHLDEAIFIGRLGETNYESNLQGGPKKLAVSTVTITQVIWGEISPVIHL